ncbi:sugar ABC transporter ATP-binding protein [Salipiger pacificus]|nr:sugar ABC transporter ATP-binding protein [Alloyangia pacifica]MCA0946991.1 sugar ABC transporter ATP-binding protein [Alloyangia pacifica]
MHDDVILKISNVSKSFGPVRALRGVDFELRRGEIHALAGENGAGKSTLMNIIDGILQPDGGEILWEGQPVRIASPSTAQQLGIGLVHQEIALCPDISVAENMFMAVTNRSRRFLMDVGSLKQKARAVLGQLCGIDPGAIVRDLPISHQQLVEIAKALTLDCKVLILDEPTAALTEREAQTLFGIMRRLSAQGISIIYISHRMVEIFENCDRVSVFRDGQYITTAPISEITPSGVVNAMVGREIGTLFPPKLPIDARTDEVVFEVRNLTDKTRFKDVSFALRSGEILGIAGLIGSGRSEIVKGICRLEGDVSGEVLLDGKPLQLRHYGDSIAAGLVYLSEDRKGDGLFLERSIAENVSALDLRRVSSAAGLIDTDREIEMARSLGAKLNLKYGRLSDPVSSLSGGNQQKVAIGKMLSVNPRLIFLDEPTRGVDVGAKSEIHRILRELASEGVGTVVISSELPELIGLCDRVLVVREGRIAGEVAGAEMTEENIMRLASGLEAALQPTVNA